MNTPYNTVRDCPVRTGKVLPHQLAHAAIVQANGCAVDGGNVWFAGPEPEPLDLTPREKAEAFALIVLFTVLSLVVIVGFAGYLYAKIFQSFFN
jgi:hypothetical protein